MIRRRGECVSSQEAEAAVRSHLAVADVAAFPVPSEPAEDEVTVAVVPGAVRTGRFAKAYCGSGGHRHHLASLDTVHPGRTSNLNRLFS